MKVYWKSSLKWKDMFTDGVWAIAVTNLSTNNEIAIVHKCGSATERGRVSDERGICFGCGKRPPTELVGMFQLFKWGLKENQ